MRFLNHSTDTINFNAQPLPVILTSWAQIKRHEPALAELESQALAMRPHVDEWWRDSRLILDQLKKLAGDGAADFSLRSTAVADIAESAIKKAFYSEAPGNG